MEGNAPRTEESLIAASRAGDAEALGALLARHLDGGYRLALLVTGRPDLAEDAVQEAFMRVCRHSEKLDPGRPVRPYLARAVVTAATDLARAETRRRRREEHAAAASGEPRPGEAAERREAAAAVGVALASLDPAERVAVGLCHREGFTEEEAAGILNVPRSTVNARAKRGLEKLRKRLAAAGFGAIAAPAVAGALAAAGPAHAPAALAGKIGSLASGARIGTAASAGTAAKGGLVMKFIAGVVLAGTVAAGVAMMGDGRGPEPLASPGGKGPPKREHFAFINQYGYLDGPRREAQAGRGPRIAADDEGNLYFFAAHYYGALRCIQPDGRIVTISGDDYWNSDMPLAEGPASCLGNPYGVRGMSFGLPSGTLVIEGVSEEGPEKGRIYTTDPYKNVVRVFRNKDKENRWWFERIAGGGKAPAPAKRGGAVAAKEVGFRSMARLQQDKDGKPVLFVDGGFYRIENGKLTCLLGPADYGDKGPQDTKRKSAASAAEGFMGGDGSFYLGYYYGVGYGGQIAAIWRVSPDGAKVEPYARDAKKGLTMEDGPALSAGFACGPHMRPMLNSAFLHPPDTLFTSAHDEAPLRRVRNGRISSLCKDGEWRELGNRAKERLAWFRNGVPGPNGTAYQTYGGATDVRTWRITGIDWGKPTAGAKLEGGK